MKRPESGHKDPIEDLDREPHKTFVFPEAIFTAVTAYQNQLVSIILFTLQVFFVSSLGAHVRLEPPRPPFHPLHPHSPDPFFLSSLCYRYPFSAMPNGVKPSSLPSLQPPLDFSIFSYFHFIRLYFLPSNLHLQSSPSRTRSSSPRISFPPIYLFIYSFSTVHDTRVRRARSATMMPDDEEVENARGAVGEGRGGGD